MSFDGRTGPDEKLLDVTYLLAGTVEDFDLPMLLMRFLKVTTRQGAAFLLIGVEVDVVSHVVVFIDGLKYFHKVKLLEVRVEPFLRNTSGRDLLILTWLIRDDTVFLDAKEKT